MDHAYPRMPFSVLAMAAWEPRSLSGPKELPLKSLRYCIPSLGNLEILWLTTKLGQSNMGPTILNDTLYTFTFYLLANIFSQINIHFKKA